MWGWVDCGLGCMRCCAVMNYRNTIIMSSYESSYSEYENERRWAARGAGGGQNKIAFQVLIVFILNG